MTSKGEKSRWVLSTADTFCCSKCLYFCLGEKIGVELCRVAVGVRSKKSNTPQIPKTRLLQHESLKINNKNITWICFMARKGHAVMLNKQLDKPTVVFYRLWPDRVATIHQKKMSITWMILRIKLSLQSWKSHVKLRRLWVSKTASTFMSWGVVRVVIGKVHYNLISSRLVRRAR